ncbi:MAG: NfeD family protein [Alphaproteobacteria bacterium]|nr:NfeD family protein [Alphaproteobacteria bacterium]MBO4644679.1 NfeD family protein [Alphaproteobacteria bacterium]
MTVADYWWWFSAGAILMVLELVTPGIFFMWIGFGAFITGVIAAIFPSATPSLLGFIFAILSVISVFVGKKIMLKKTGNEDNGLNNRMAQYIGQVYQVYEPIVDGRGKISVGDTLWLAVAKADIAAGTSVKVTGVHGTTLEVEPVDEK